MTADGPAVVLGAGNIGVGVFLHALWRSGYDSVAVTRDPRRAWLLRTRGARIRAVGDGVSELELPPTPTVTCAQRTTVTELLRSASLVVVAVRPHQLSAVARLLSPGLRHRRDPVNILVCDNRAAAGALLATEVALVDGSAAVMQHGFASTLVDQIATTHHDATGPVVHVETPGRLLIDARALRTEPPRLPAALLVEDHAAYVLHKLFLFSAGHMAAALAGRVRHHVLMTDAATDPVVVEQVRQVLLEARAGLEHCYGAEFVGPADLFRGYLRRYGNPGLADTVERVARDPGRKLAADDRICGPARLALAFGTRTPALAMVARMALQAHATSQGVPLGRTDGDCAGWARLMARTSGLPQDHPFVQMTAHLPTGGAHGRQSLGTRPPRLTSRRRNGLRAIPSPPVSGA